MSLPFLHAAHNRYDLRAIMARAWVRARNATVRQAAMGFPMTLREAFSEALRATWDEARSARSLATWRAEQDAQAEANKALDARTREIIALRAGRLAADGIDSGPRYRAEIYAIDARLSQLGA